MSKDVKTVKFPTIPVVKTPPIKLKDKPGRGGIQIVFKRDFGFAASSVIIQKVHGKNNTIVVSAPKPKSMIKAEEQAAETEIAALKSPEIRKRIEADIKKKNEEAARKARITGKKQ